MEELAIKIEHVSKQYRLGAIGGGTLKGDLQSWWARKRGKEDPNSIIGSRTDVKIGERFLALDDINLEVKKGEALGIIGHNGAGKSTLLKLLSRVTAPTTGKISYNGRITSMLEVGTGFHPELTGRENIYMNGAILGLTKAEIDAKMEDIIEFSEVRQFIDTPVKRYSSGMYVKLAFSVAAHLDSEIMIMDEVLAVGDLAFQNKCLAKMREASEIEGRTVLYVSHNMNTIRQLCDRCVVLNKGKIVYVGDVGEAIGIYSNVSKDSESIVYDLSDAGRAYKEYGTRIKITGFHFLNVEQAVFERTQPMDFSLTMDAYEDIPDIKLYFVLTALNGERIGMTQTMDSILDAKKGHSYSPVFRFDCSNLAPGKYYFQPDLFWLDVEGRHHSLDHPMKSICFEIIDTHRAGINWQPYFSHVRLNTLQVIQ